jgi:hypothetical protein
MIPIYGHDSLGKKGPFQLLDAFERKGLDVESKLIAFRDTELYDRIAERAAKDNKSFADTCRDLMRFALETTDNRIADNVIPFQTKTATRRFGKSLNTVSLRDDPLGTMLEAGDITEAQYEIGRAVEWHFRQWHGQNVRSNFPSRERVSESGVHGVWHKEDGKLQLTPRDLSSIPTNDEVAQAREFLRQARETLSATAYQLVADVIYNKKPTLRVQQFGAALDNLAPLCGYATHKQAA